MKDFYEDDKHYQDVGTPRDSVGGMVDNGEVLCNLLMLCLSAGSANPVFGSKSAIDASRMVDELQSWVTKNPDGYM